MSFTHFKVAVAEPSSTPMNHPSSSPIKISSKKSHEALILTFPSLSLPAHLPIPPLLMAIATLCSSPTHSPTLPAVAFSSLSSSPSLKTHLPAQTHLPIPLSFTKFEPNLVSNDAFAIVGADEAWSCKDSENGWALKRRKRRKRKKEFNPMEEDEEKMDGKQVFSASSSLMSGLISSREEAALCLYLKEGAKLELARKKIMETQENEPTMKDLAEALGAEMRSIDKKLCKGRESREKIIRSYRRLVVSIASGYQGRGLSLQDLIQEGSIGLLKGVEKFEPERGNKLSTYVYYWIRQAIIKSIEKKSRLIRLSGNMSQMITRISEAKNILSERLRRLPTYDELAELVNVDVSMARLASEMSRLPVSLNQPLTDRGSLTLQEILAGPDELTPEYVLMRESKKQEVEKLLKSLNEREEKVVRLYFGIDGKVPLCYEEIGKRLKLSRERIRQINSTAMSKIRQNSSLHSLKFYVI